MSAHLESRWADCTRRCGAGEGEGEAERADVTPALMKSGTQAQPPLLAGETKECERSIWFFFFPLVVVFAFHVAQVLTTRRKQNPSLML